MSHRIIFLDFDGVIITRQSLMALSKLPRGMEGRPSQQYACDPDCIAALNFLVSPKTFLVVSSTWRLDHSVADLRGLLKSWGATSPVLDKTPRLIAKQGSIYIAGPRGAEIQKWLDSYPRDVESFVILDDDSDMGELLPRLVKTSMDGGLTTEHVERAREILAMPVEYAGKVG